MTLLRMIAFTPLEIVETSPPFEEGGDGSGGSSESPISQILSQLSDNQSKSTEKKARSVAKVVEAKPLTEAEIKTKHEQRSDGETKVETKTKK